MPRALAECLPAAQFFREFAATIGKRIAPQALRARKGGSSGAFLGSQSPAFIAYESRLLARIVGIRAKVEESNNMKRNALLSAVALASLVTVSACGTGATPEAADEDQAATATDTATEAPAEETAEAAAPEVEANGTVIEIQMFTKDPDNASGLQVFKPRVVTAKVGDTIKFVPTDPTHQSDSIAGMIPEGTKGWEGKVNQEVSYVIPKEGVYGYKCTPHYAAGMIGLVIVGEGAALANLEAAKGVTHPGLAAREFEKAFTEAGI
jgi:pseudoazurin